MNLDEAKQIIEVYRKALADVRWLQKEDLFLYEWAKSDKEPPVSLEENGAYLRLAEIPCNWSKASLYLLCAAKYYNTEVRLILGSSEIIALPTDTVETVEARHASAIIHRLNGGGE